MGVVTVMWTANLLQFIPATLAHDYTIMTRGFSPQIHELIFSEGTRTSCGDLVAWSLVPIQLLENVIEIAQH